MTIEQRIERMKKRNEFFYDEDIALCIQSLEAWQKVKEELQKLIEWHDCPIEYDGGNDAWYCAAIGMALVIIDIALGKVGEQNG